MKRRAVVAVMVIAAAAAGLMSGYRLGTGQSATNPEPAVSSTAEARTRVSALGRLEPRGRLIALAIPEGSGTAVVSRWLIDEGQDVSAGDVLAELSTLALRQTELAEAQAARVAAEAELTRVLAGAKRGQIAAAESTVSLARSELDSARRELSRAESLRARNAVSEADLNDYQLTADQAAARLEQARSELEAVVEVREVDVAVARAKLHAAEASADAAQRRVELCVIRAPGDGRLLRIRTQAGEAAGPDGVGEFGDVEHMQAVAEVFEGDLPLIRIGQRALVRVETAGLEFSGVVSQQGHVVGRKSVLSNDPVSDTDARVVEVRIDISRQDSEVLRRLTNARVLILIDVGSGDAGAAAGAACPDCRDSADATSEAPKASVHYGASLRE